MKSLNENDNNFDNFRQIFETVSPRGSDEDFIEKVIQKSKQSEGLPMRKLKFNPMYGLSAALVAIVSVAGLVVLSLNVGYTDEDIIPKASSGALNSSRESRESETTDAVTDDSTFPESARTIFMPASEPGGEVVAVLVPELVKVEATNGKTGFCYQSDLDGYGYLPTSQEDAVDYMRRTTSEIYPGVFVSEERVIPVYAIDGETVIGEFIQGGGVSFTSLDYGDTYEEAFDFISKCEIVFVSDIPNEGAHILHMGFDDKVITFGDEYTYAAGKSAVLKEIIIFDDKIVAGILDDEDDPIGVGVIVENPPYKQNDNDRYDGAELRYFIVEFIEGGGGHEAYFELNNDIIVCGERMGGIYRD